MELKPKEPSLQWSTLYFKATFCNCTKKIDNILHTKVTCICAIYINLKEFKGVKKAVR